MFSIPIRVYYEDTDAGGVVYYANYLKYIERARTEFLRAAGYDQSELGRKIGVQFVVRSASLDLKKPARLDDQLDVTCEVANYGRASLLFEQQVMRHTNEALPALLCAATIKIACVDIETFRPSAIPGELFNAINIK
ncbi:MAG: tol-pal system-associated acyl-CoA thioesterase [Pseudomonadota bacterium]